jgi:ATP-dependent DNA helicase RecG
MLNRADELEDQYLDFKEWKGRSMKDAVEMVIEAAVCMANVGGGTVVFGINDKGMGRAKAVLGVPIDGDVNRLKKAVYELEIGNPGSFIGVLSSSQYQFS